MDTFAASYISNATREVRAVATAAEARNMLCCPNPASVLGTTSAYLGRFD